MKMVMLIKYAEEKENSPSKRYEMSKWSSGNAILVTDWNTVLCHIALLKFLMMQINDELHTFSNFSNQGTN